jgi:hypothetical protein
MNQYITLVCTFINVCLGAFCWWLVYELLKSNKELGEVIRTETEIQERLIEQAQK